MAINNSNNSSNNVSSNDCNICLNSRWGLFVLMTGGGYGNGKSSKE